ncbi:MAG: hypothetical protein WBG43_04490 [Marinifilaceae bacterium]
MKALIRLLSLFFICSLAFSSCSKSDLNKDATVTINVKDILGKKVSNMTVYRFNSNTWKVIGNKPFHSDSEYVTDENGVASFTIPSINFFSDHTETFYFSCHYTDGKVSKTEYIGVSLKKGDSVTKELILR